MAERKERLLTSLVVIGGVLAHTGVAAALDPALACIASKLKEAGKYASCRATADSTAIKKNESADYSKCDAKLSDKWQKIEGKGGCNIVGDETRMMQEIIYQASANLSTITFGPYPFLKISFDPSVAFGFIDDLSDVTHSLVSDSPVGNVVDVDVFLAITHTFTGDLDISLSYGGTEIALLQDVGGGADGLTVLLSDDASTSITSVANTTGSPITGVYKPLEPLSTFDGVEGSGSWNLRVVDDFVGDTGTLWIVEIRIIRQ